jgi:protein-S-isoprenylcysteine O-methyltransferase Ste14
MIALDRSFSIAPAKREIVTRGPYKYMRHPMYGGEILSLIGVLIASFSLWNVVIFIIFLASVLWRIRVEENLLGRDVFYAKSVPWLSLL